MGGGGWHVGGAVREHKRLTIVLIVCYSFPSSSRLLPGREASMKSPEQGSGLCSLKRSVSCDASLGSHVACG